MKNILIFTIGASLSISAFASEPLSPYDLASKIRLKEGMTAKFEVTTVPTDGLPKKWQVTCKKGEYPLELNVDAVTYRAPACTGWEAWFAQGYKSIYISGIHIE